MLFLALSIVCTSYLVFAFKVFDRYKVNHFHAIVINYITCVVTGSIVNGYAPRYSDYATRDWFPIAAILGCSFITLFNVMSIVTRRQGITVTNVATKLSMVIPIAVAVALYNEPMSLMKIVGVGCAMLAVYFVSLHPDPEHDNFSFKHLMLPAILFFGSGVNDSLVKHAQQVYLKTTEFNDFNVVIFTISAMAGSLALLFDVFRLKHNLTFRSVTAGVLLGVPNYFSLFFLIKALEQPQWGASVIFPLNNIGIVAFSAVIAWLFFREKLSAKNWFGLMLAAAAILLTTLG